MRCLVVFLRLLLAVLLFRRREDAGVNRSDTVQFAIGDSVEQPLSVFGREADSQFNGHGSSSKGGAMGLCYFAIMHRLMPSLIQGVEYLLIPFALSLSRLRTQSSL